MKRSLFLILCLSGLLFNCQAPTPDAANTTEATPTEIDTTPRVTGIGGIFFKSEDPGATKAWYSENLGMKVDDFGAPFEFRNANRPEEVNYLNWDAFVDSTNYFDPSSKPFMINYRVQNLEGLVANLKANGVTILDEMTVVDYGKFIHILDNEGNKIELWEPVDSVLATFGRSTNK
ncbi:MAG: VOC family protein [Bacteroidota bacterium]